MKIIGLIGGMSWESTQHYYQLMNHYVQSNLGEHNSIEAIIYSVNFERILSLVSQNKWDSVGDVMVQLAKKLENAGADFLMLTSNAAHKVFSQIEKAVHIPILHIVDPTAAAIKKEGLKKVGLLGTPITMEESFYKKRLQNLYDIEALVPNSEDRKSLGSIIFNELTIGKIDPNSKRKLIDIIEKLVKQGAEGIILGCTELTLLISQQDTSTLLFDTASLHAKAAVDLACDKHSFS